MMDDGNSAGFLWDRAEKMTVSDLMELSKACSKQIDNDRMLLNTRADEENLICFFAFIQKFDFVFGNILKAVLP